MEGYSCLQLDNPIVSMQSCLQIYLQVWQVCSRACLKAVPPLENLASVDLMIAKSDLKAFSTFFRKAISRGAAIQMASPLCPAGADKAGDPPEY